jgi:hypothetical protein
MTIHEQLGHAEHSLQRLEGAVVGLRSLLGPDLDVQRLADDVARCRDDLARLRRQAPAPQPAPERDVIVIPDDEYDSGLWQGGDVDAEGLGVPGRRAP